MSGTVCLRPKTEEARAILETYGDIWQVVITAPDPIYGSVRRLHLESLSDGRNRGMWVQDKYDDLFEVIYF